MIYPIYDTYFSPQKGGIPTNQLNIIRYIARHGKQSKSKLANKKGLNKNWSEIDSAITKLIKDKGLIQSDSSTEHEKEKFYQLTIEGFKVAIEDPLMIPKNHNWKKLTNNEFWNYLVNELGKITQNEISELDKLYQKQVLDVDFDYYIPIMFDRWTKDKNYDDWFYFEEIQYNRSGFDNEIAFIVAESNRMTKTELIRKLDNLKNRHHTKTDNFEYHVDQAILDGYLQFLHGEIELTHSGFLEYLFLFYRKHFVEHEELVDLEKYKYNDLSKDKKSLEKLEKIREKYAFLLPDIFNDSNFNKLGISLYDVVKILLKIYKNLGKEELDTIYGDREYFEIEENKAIERYLQTRKEAQYRIFLNYVDIEMMDKYNLENMNNAIKWYYKLVFSIGNYEFLDERLKKVVLNPKNNYYRQFDFKIEKLISFEFYLHYKMYVGGWNNSEMKDSKIRKNHDQEVRILINFSKKHLEQIEHSL